MRRLRSDIRRHTLPVLIALGGLSLFAPAGALASASRGNQIIRECVNNDSVGGGYSHADYQYALAHLPSDVNEYTDCADVIRRAELAAASGNRAGASGRGVAGSGASSSPLAGATPAERAAVTRARHERPAAVTIAGHVVHPAVIALRPAGLTHTLPTPLLIVLIALATGVLAGGGALAHRVRARRPR